MTGSVTIYDVAARAGVSISTVSQAINRPSRVNPRTRDRVLQAIEDLKYVPKAAAVSQARQGVGRIGVLAPFTAYESYRRRLTGVLAESEGANRDVIVYDHESATASVSPLLRTLPATGRLDGLLIMGLPLDDALAENLLTRRLPTVLVDSSRPEFHTVNVDDDEGGALAARHLLGRGHRSFAFVQERQESFAFLSQGQRRIRGFLAAVAAAGGDPETVHTVLTSNNVTGGRQALHEVLARRPTPTAVFALHDVLAAGLLAASRRRGVRVPDDLAVVGFDDGTVAEATALTTVCQPFEESGRLGARLLGELLRGTSESLQRIVLGLELVVRDST